MLLSINRYSSCLLQTLKISLSTVCITDTDQYTCYYMYCSDKLYSKVEAGDNGETFSRATVRVRSEVYGASLLATS